MTTNTLLSSRLAPITAILLMAFISCTRQQTNTKKMTDETMQTNPLLCNTETGTCEMPGSENHYAVTGDAQPKNKPVKVIYFTDPICSSCWGIEPQLRKLKLEYGNVMEIEYRMGGLLPNWSYNSGGISKPSDVAHHWDEVSVYYDMPIDGDVWLSDPLNSSYPPSVAFKAAQLQDQEKAVLFLREIREMVFLKKKNITRWEHIAEAAATVGLDVGQLKTDFEGRANTAFEKDLQIAQEYGVRGFPTLFFTDGAGHKELVYGSKPFDSYENAILKLLPKATKNVYGKNWQSLFSSYQTLTAREFSELSGVARSESEQVLDSLVSKGILKKTVTKNGSIWKKVSN